MRQYVIFAESRKFKSGATFANAEKEAQYRAEAVAKAIGLGVTVPTKASKPDDDRKRRIPSVEAQSVAKRALIDIALLEAETGTDLRGASLQATGLGLTASGVWQQPWRWLPLVG